VAVSAKRLHAIAGVNAGKDDLIAVVRNQRTFLEPDTRLQRYFSDKSKEKIMLNPLDKRWYNAVSENGSQAVRLLTSAWLHLHPAY
jgi:hypothetical protein